MVPKWLEELEIGRQIQTILTTAPIDQNIEKSPGDLRRIDLCQTVGESHQPSANPGGKKTSEWITDFK